MRGDSELQLSLRADGTVRRAGTAVLAPEANACIDVILAHHRMGREVTSARSVMLELGRSSAREIVP